MIALGIRFTAGRFHATPWGRHVNEGAPEWPPSPWRLLRALVATWKRTLDGDPACSPEVVERVARALAGCPSFHLPPASTAHTRHYMPWFKKGPLDKTLVFDAFVAVDPAREVIVVWPEARLDAAARDALERLAEHLSFLGRAESWVEARVLSDQEADAVEPRCLPMNGEPIDGAFEPVRVLCADPGTAFANDHTPKRTTGKGKSKVVRPMYDPDWHICIETAQLHKERWSDPPGSRWVSYVRPKDAFAVAPRQRAPRERARPTVARFAIDGPVLPTIDETLRVAEAARRVAMGCFRRVEELRLYGGARPDEAPLPRSPVFAGKDARGEKLLGHGHAYYLPTDEDGDGRLDHLTIVAAMGFGRAEVAALDRMRRLPRDEGEPLNLLLLALGQLDAIAAPAVLGPSKAWRSATPFVVTRHAKRRGRKKDPPELLGAENARAFARKVLEEELDRLRQRRPELPEPVRIEPLDEHRIGARGLRPIQFKRFRRKRGDDGGRRPAGAFRVLFPSEVRGPLCLGHSSHFGLGLFVPEEPAP